LSWGNLEVLLCSQTGGGGDTFACILTSDRDVTNGKQPIQQSRLWAGFAQKKTSGKSTAQKRLGKKRRGAEFTNGKKNASG